jgi:hypothetical protein
VLCLRHKGISLSLLSCVLTSVKFRNQSYDSVHWKTANGNASQKCLIIALTLLYSKPFPVPCIPVVLYVCTMTAACLSICLFYFLPLLVRIYPDLPVCVTAKHPYTQHTLYNQLTVCAGMLWSTLRVRCVCYARREAICCV